MDAIVNELQNIGFTKYESQIYISLLKESPLTGYEISKLSGVPQSKVYENITKLLNNNIIINIETDPIKYVPINPNELLKSKKEEFNNSMDKLENNLQVLNKGKSIEYVLNIKGSKNILKKAIEMINNAKQEIIISCSHEEILNLKDELLTASKKNVNVEILLLEDKNIEGLSNIHIHGGNETTLKNKKLYKGILLIVDDSEILTGNLSEGNEAISIWTKNSNILYIGNQYIQHEIYISQKIKGGLKYE
ncbi:TrmB family transcriptional regulator [Clostridioides sp. ZZV15-6598]|uniref:TrmB family transcriptional regulator n=1 Tax=Clostridioides sp. ZZV15-6598 TaxID=2811501 RepID=UPI001D0FD2DA|nr:TrmB family transcriptional regulator [Clostridioides sp. ZZV15-6598]